MFLLKSNGSDRDYFFGGSSNSNSGSDSDSGSDSGSGSNSFFGKVEVAIEITKKVATLIYRFDSCSMIQKVLQALLERNLIKWDQMIVNTFSVKCATTNLYY